MITVQCREIRRGGRVVLREMAAGLPHYGCSALVGINGAGKTTWLMAVADVLRDRGRCTVTVHDENAPADRPGGRLPGAIAFGPQRPTFPEWLCAHQCARLFGCTFESLAEAYPELLLDELRGLEVRSMSAGQLQTLSIVLALHTSASLILLDEPFAPLDFRRRIGLVHVIRRVAERSAIVVSTQSANEMLDVCDQAIVLKAGTCVYCGSIDALLGVGTERENAALDNSLRRELFERHITSML